MLDVAAITFFSYVGPSVRPRGYGSTEKKRSNAAWSL